jgi:hypothetical protein
MAVSKNLELILEVEAKSVQLARLLKQDARPKSELIQKHASTEPLGQVARKATAIKPLTKSSQPDFVNGLTLGG